MIGFYIIFGLLCILLGFAIVSWFIISKEIRNRINDYSDYTEFIEFNDILLNKSVIECIVKHDKHITIITNNSADYVEKFDSKEECNKRYLDILDCISYYPKSY